MIVLLDLIIALFILAGATAGVRLLLAEQKLWYAARPSWAYVRGKKVFTNKSVARWPWSPKVVQVNMTSDGITFEDDIMTQYGVCRVQINIDAKIDDPLTASGLFSDTRLGAYDVLSHTKSKLRGVLQNVLNTAGNTTMAYTKDLHDEAAHALQEFYRTQGMQMESFSFRSLELKSAAQGTNVEVEVEPEVRRRSDGTSSLQL